MKIQKKNDEVIQFDICQPQQEWLVDINQTMLNILNNNYKLIYMKPNYSENGNNGPVKWLDSQDILLSLHISERTLRRWRSKNLLPFSRIGGKIYYRETDLLALLEKNVRHAKS
jgi:hypothetical protein